jgi:hypothetical protein
MTGTPIATRTAGIVLAGLLSTVVLCGCASTHRHAAVPPINPAAPTRIVPSPTPTSPPDTVQGPITTQLPAGVTTVTVSFLQPGDPPGAVVYRTTLTSPTDIRALADAVDALHATGTYSKGCSMSPVDLRLDFVGPSHTSSFLEDSSCRYATLTIDGVAGPKLDSAELDVAEKVVGKTAVFGPDGRPSLAAAPSSSAS